jgi:hypothetical protein
MIDVLVPDSSARTVVILGVRSSLTACIESRLGDTVVKFMPVAGDEMSDGIASYGLEEYFGNLLPADTDALIIGEGIFPEFSESPESLREGLLRCFTASKIAVRAMMRRKRGRIIFVLPAVGDVSWPNTVRGALRGLALSISKEVASRNIAAMVVDPNARLPREEPSTPDGSSEIVESLCREVLFAAGLPDFSQAKVSMPATV